MQALAGLGFAVDLLATALHAPEPAELAAVRGVVDDVILVARRHNLTGVFSRAPVQVHTRGRLRQVRLNASYDLAVLETEAVAAVLDNPHLRAKVVALRIQNDEPRYFQDLARSERDWLKKAYYATEARRYRRFLPAMHARVDRLWFISAEERDAFAAAAGPPIAAHAYFLPAPLDPNGFRPHPASGANVLFVGTLSLPVNVEALCWYLDYVHPELQSLPGYHLVIAGNTRGTQVDWLRRRVKKLGDVDLQEDPSAQALDALYASSCIFVNPAQSGAGVKLKTINAIEAGLPVVCTTVGKQGTGLRAGVDVQVEDQPATFAEAVRRLLGNPATRRSLVAEAQRFLGANYDHQGIIRASLNGTCGTCIYENS
jgi:glycosyltransferase involved in cell wall biosynthesis